MADKHRSECRSILFLCTGNACRSPMAEAIARALRPDLTIRSAGIVETGVQPGTLRTLKEIGLDGSDLKSKLLESIDSKSVDLVISLCDRAAEEMEASGWRGPNTAHLRWPTPDPYWASLSVPVDDPNAVAAFRETREILRRRLSEFFGDSDA